jgi:hypothetical protein
MCIGIKGKGPACMTKKHVKAPTALAKKFNAESKLPYEFTLAIGDWSDDGHGQCKEFTFHCSHKVEQVRAAYLTSVKQFGISFDPDHKAKIMVLTRGGERSLSDKAQKKLTAIGYDMTKIPEPEFVSPEELANLILWFAGKQLKNFAAEKKEKTYMNGFWNKQLNAQFGYGAFGDKLE